MRYVSNIYNFQISSAVKALIIANGVLWFFFILILQGLFFQNNGIIFHFFGLSFHQVVSKLWLWQLISYFFIHSSSLFHILFNMFALWMFGSELERLWGKRFFLIYYFSCGIGSGLIYLFCIGIGATFFNIGHLNLNTPMVGASGAIFGVLFAYGLIFSERIIYFMMLFPIKARHFTILIAFIEFVSLINSGLGSPISHLAHLSGFASGFFFLKIWKNIQDFHIKKLRKKGYSHLKVIKNEKENNNSFH